MSTQKGFWCAMSKNMSELVSLLCSFAVIDYTLDQFLFKHAYRSMYA